MYVGWICVQALSEPKVIVLRERQPNVPIPKTMGRELAYPVSTGLLCPLEPSNPAHDCEVPSNACQLLSTEEGRKKNKKPRFRQDSYNSGAIMVAEVYPMKDVIKEMAKKHGVSEVEIRESICEAIEVAWNTLDPETKRQQRELFPRGKPSPEEFICVVANMIVL